MFSQGSSQNLNLFLFYTSAINIIIVNCIMVTTQSPLEIVFQVLSYSSLHSGQNLVALAWDHFCGVIANPCGDWQLPMWRLEIVQGPMPIVA